MTLTGGGRLELQKESRNTYTTPWPSKYLAAAPVTFPAADVVNWKDFNPRVGFSYDVFGDGKTAVKASMARGVLQEGINTADAVNPGNALITSTARTVNETTFPVGDPRRLNGLPDCDLTNPAANGGCGALADDRLRCRESTPQTVLDPRDARPAGASARITGNSRPASSTS